MRIKEVSAHFRLFIFIGLHRRGSLGRPAQPPSGTAGNDTALVQPAGLLGIAAQLLLEEMANIVERFVRSL